MVSVPQKVMERFVAMLNACSIPSGQTECYKKWLRYFYDFSANYLHEQDQTVRVKLFLDKLKSKGQSPAQCQQAAHAVTIYFELLAHSTSNEMYAEQADTARRSVPMLFQPTGSQSSPQTSAQLRPSQYSVPGYQEKSDSPEWDKVMEKLAAEIKVRHYSRKTLKTYALWSRQFQRFLKNKAPSELTTEDVKAYLTHLAVKCHVAASTQKQEQYLKAEGRGLKAEG